MRLAHIRPTARQRLGALLAAAAAVAALVTAAGSQAGGNSADFFAVDADPAGNTATSIGTIENCVEVNKGASATVDVVISGVPTGSGAMQAFTYQLSYPSGVSITGMDTNGLLSTAPGYSGLDLSEPLPDADGLLMVDIADLNAAGVSGSGYLTRLTVEVAAGASNGLKALDLTLAEHGDLQNDFWSAPVQNAFLAVGVTCDDLPPPTKKGDVDCNETIDSVDALKILRHVAGLDVQQAQGCTPIGQGNPMQGDIDCGGTVNAVDSLNILRFVAGLLVNLPGGCAPINT